MAKTPESLDDRQDPFGAALAMFLEIANVSDLALLEPDEAEVIAKSERALFEENPWYTRKIEDK
jgi:hypothetical protein